MTIDGKALARKTIEALRAKKTPTRTLVAILVGNDPASASFVAQKKKVAHELGVRFELVPLPQNASFETLKKKIKTLAAKRSCGGILVQLPLPTHLDTRAALNCIPREKDVDVLGAAAQGAFAAGTNIVLPPAVGTLVKVLDHALIVPQGDDVSLAGWFVKNKKVAVVGLGALVGRPIATWLTGRCEELHLLDKGADLATLKKMDVVILGTGVAHLVNAKMLKRDAHIIDFGYGTKRGALAGDFDPKNAARTLEYTPTPGGTGPILVASLLENFYRLNA